MAIKRVSLSSNPDQIMGFVWLSYLIVQSNETHMRVKSTEDVLGEALREEEGILIVSSIILHMMLMTQKL